MQQQKASYGNSNVQKSNIVSFESTQMNLKDGKLASKRYLLGSFGLFSIVLMAVLLIANFKKDYVHTQREGKQRIFLSQMGELKQLEQNIISEQKGKEDQIQAVSNIPRILWIYQRQANQENRQLKRLLLDSWYDKSVRSQYKLVILNGKNAKNFLDEQQIKRINQAIVTRAPEHQSAYFRDWLKLSILEKYGGVFLQNSIILNPALSFIDQLIQRKTLDLRNPVYNRWDLKPQVCMFHSSQSKQKIVVYNKFYDKIVQEPWKIRYSPRHFIASVKNARLIKQWLAEYVQMLTFDKERILEKGNYQYLQNAFDNILHRILQKRPDYREQDHFQNYIQMDFKPSRRAYKIWSIKGSEFELNGQVLSKLRSLATQESNQLAGKAKDHMIINLQSLKLNDQLLKDVELIEKLVQLLALNAVNVTEGEIRAQAEGNIGLITASSVLNLEQSSKQLSQPTQSSSQLSQPQSIPKNLFLFTPSSIKPNFDLFSSLNTLNTIKIFSQSNYQIIKVTPQNYHNYISAQSNGKVKAVRQMLQQKVHQKDDNAITYKDKIVERLTIYFLIHQNGGVWVSEDITIFDSVDNWIRSGEINWFANGGNSNRKDSIGLDKVNLQGYKALRQSQLTSQNIKYFAFYDTDYSSIKTKLEQGNGHPRDTVIYPSFDDSCLAGVKGGEYLGRVIETYIDLLMDQKRRRKLSRLDKDQGLIGLTDCKSMYKDDHKLAQHIVLQQKQLELSGLSQHKQKQHSLATEYYGVVTINNYVGPLKVQKNFLGSDHKLYVHLTKLTVKQLQYQIGPLVFMLKLNEGVKEFIAQRLFYKQVQTQTQYLLEDSFVHKFFIKPSQEYLSNRQNTPGTQGPAPFVQALGQTRKYNSILNIPKVKQNLQQTTTDLQSPGWQSFGKHVWIIWDTGLNGKSNVIVELCYQNLRKSAQQSNLQMHLITKDSIKDYLEEEVLERINYAVKHADFDISRQAVTDMWRLALIYKYGGVYLDASTFTISQNFEWLKFITRLPTNLIWNRYGKQPQVLMFFNGHYGCPLDWHFDAKHRTKSQWHLSYENNFIAAVKQSKLIKEWLDTLMEWIVTPFDIVGQQMKDVGMWQDKWTVSGNRYLTAMDSLKYVLGFRQKQLKASKEKSHHNSADYFKLWGMSGDMIGQQKLRSETSYEHFDYRLNIQQIDLNNIYKYQYSEDYIQSVLGPIKFQTKFFNLDLVMMTLQLDQIYYQNKGNFSESFIWQKIHPHSIVAKKLLNANITNTKGLIQYYSTLSQMRLKLKSVAKIWY